MDWALFGPARFAQTTRYNILLCFILNYLAVDFDYFEAYRLNGLGFLIYAICDMDLYIFEWDRICVTEGDKFIINSAYLSFIINLGLP